MGLFSSKSSSANVITTTTTTDTDNFETAVNEIGDNAVSVGSGAQNTRVVVSDQGAIRDSFDFASDAVLTAQDITSKSIDSSLDFSQSIFEDNVSLTADILSTIEETDTKNKSFLGETIFGVLDLVTEKNLEFNSEVIQNAQESSNESIVLSKKQAEQTTNVVYAVVGLVALTLFMRSRGKKK